MQESPPQDLVAYVPETRFPRMRRTSISAQEGLKGFARAITGGMEEMRNMLRRTPLTGKLLVPPAPTACQERASNALHGMSSISSFLDDIAGAKFMLTVCGQRSQP